MFTPPASPIPTRTYRTNQTEVTDVDHRWPPHLTVSRSSSPSSSSSRSSSPSPASATTPALGSFPSTPSCTGLHGPSLDQQHLQSIAKKRRTARRTRWTILLVPVALVIVTLSTRYLSHPALFDVFSPDYAAESWQELGQTLLDWRPHDHAHVLLHKRTPDPDPQGSGGGESVISFPPVSTSTPSSSPSTSSASASSTSSGDSSSSTIPTIPASPPVLPTPFPQPFTVIAQNFSTESCETFFDNMTAAEPFRACRPFSLLLQSSSEFIEAQTNISLLNTMVWGTCNTDPSAEQCTENMGWFQGELEVACAKEMSEDNALVTSTFIGLQVYSLMRTVACLPNTTTNAYCYIDAVNSSHLADSAYYSLPLGQALPNNSAPSCMGCTQDLMAEYVEEGLNFTGLKETYAGAAEFTNKFCGSGFVQEEQKATSGARDGRLTIRWTLISVGLSLLGTVLGGVW